MTARAFRSWTLFGVLAACGMIAGCSNSTATQSTSSSGGGSPDGATAVEFPEGDPSVSAELGGPGFTGEGWTTAAPRPLGDPAAVKGGTIQSPISLWPDNLRIYGKGANTVLNDISMRLCYDTLLEFDLNTLELVPRLASHWKLSADGMKFSYRINPKAHWSDGKPVTADDVIATHRLLVDKTLEDPSYQDAFKKFKEPVAKSKYIVEVECVEKDWLNFINFSREMAILPAHEIAAIGGKGYLDDYNFKFAVGSGPYIVHPQDIKNNESLTLTRRKDYWGLDEPFNTGLYNFDRIRFSVVLDPRLAFDKVCKGEIDFQVVTTAKWWVEELDDLDAVKKGHLIRRKIFTRYPQDFQGLAFNMRSPPLDDVRVRKAFAHLFDRKGMVEKFAYNEYALFKSYYPGSDAENPDNVLVEYNPEKAAQLLAEAGWSKRGPDGILVKDGKRLSLTLSYATRGFEKYFTSLKEDCKRAGLELNLRFASHETLWPDTLDHKFEIVQQAWALTLFPSPKSSYHSSMADAKGSTNITGLKNSEADKLIDAYEQEFDLQKRTALLRQLDDVVYREHPYALAWNLPCQRVLYWDKFGMPASGLRKFEDDRGVFLCWWSDPEKVKRLQEARKTGAGITPIPPVELHPWDSDAGKTALR